VIAVPLGWINYGTGKGLYGFIDSGVVQGMQRALRKKDVPYGLTVSPIISSLNNFELAFTLYHNEFLDPRRKVRLGLKFGGEGNFKVYYGSRFGRSFD